MHCKESCFELKGGTAINLFVRDFPRLSVVADLTYLGDESRDEDFKGMTNFNFDYPDFVKTL